MRDSFIFHFEYLEDIPDDLQAKYAMQIINYARYGEEPQCTDWRDQRMWNRIKERMDEETVKYEKKCRNLRHQSQDQQEPAQVETYTNEAPEEKPKRRVFKEPTEEEVEAYCRSRNNTVDAKRFISHYQRKDWMVGKTKMKDWKAAVRYWETTERKPSTTKTLPEDRIEL